MNNVSRALRGQYSSSGSLRVVAGALCIAMCVPVFASGDQRTTAVAQQMRALAPTMHEIRPNGAVHADARRTVQFRSQPLADDEDAGEVRSAGDRRSLKRALADGSDAATAERRKNLTREERRALKRELRDAMQGANSLGASPIPPSR